MRHAAQPIQRPLLPDITAPGQTSNGRRLLDLYPTDSVTAAWFVWHKGWSWDRVGVARPFVFLKSWNVQPLQGGKIF